MTLRVRIALLVCLALGAPNVRAQPVDATRADATQLQRARSHFEAARALYSLGNYETALQEFVAGYQLAPRPGFLANIGHCHRRLGHLTQAKEAYREFLHQMPSDAPEVPSVRSALAELDALPVVPPVGTTQPITPAAVVAETAVASPSVVVPASAPRPRSFWRKHFWIVPMGAVVLTGGALGLYFGLRGRGAAQVGCDDAELGCLRPSL